MKTTFKRNEVLAAFKLFNVAADSIPGANIDKDVKQRMRDLIDEIASDKPISEETVRRLNYEFINNSHPGMGTIVTTDGEIIMEIDDKIVVNIFKVIEDEMDAISGIAIAIYGLIRSFKALTSRIAKKFEIILK